MFKKIGIVVIGLSILLGSGYLAWRAWLGSSAELVDLLIDQPDWIYQTVPETIQISESLKGSLFKPSQAGAKGAIVLSAGLVGTPDRDDRLRSLGNALAKTGYVVLVPHGFDPFSSNASQLLGCEGEQMRIKAVVAGSQWLHNNKALNPLGNLYVMSTSLGSHGALEAIADASISPYVKGLFMISPFDDFYKTIIYTFSGSYPVNEVFQGDYLAHGGMLAPFASGAILYTIPAGHPEAELIKQHYSSFRPHAPPGMEAEMPLTTEPLKASNFSSLEGRALFYTSQPPKGVTVEQISKHWPTLLQQTAECWTVSEQAIEKAKTIPSIIIHSEKDGLIYPQESEALAVRLGSSVYSSEMISHFHISKNNSKYPDWYRGKSLVSAIKEFEEMMAQPK